MKTQIEAKIAELSAQAKALQSQIDGFELDPVAYRCGLLDYLDGLDQDEEKMNNDSCLELFEELEEIKSEIEELEDEMSELEND